MRKPNGLQRTALLITRLIGSPISVMLHTAIFIITFLPVPLHLISFDLYLLILTTVVSLEAIYLALFNQLAINYANEGIEAVGKDIEEIQEDVGELQEDVGEISEDVEEISEDDEEEDKLEAEQKKTLTDIQTDLRKLMADIERLRNNGDATALK